MAEIIINDNIHGHISLPNICMSIVDTREFQRLRYIKQCGFSYLVYPTSNHTRFEHCLGVCYLAGEMIDKLNNNSKEEKINKREKLLIQIAGLIHDLGHGPFSHLWDKFLRSVNIESDHEQRSYDIFRSYFDDVLQKCKNNLINIQTSFTEVEKELIMTFCEKDYEFIFDVINGRSKSPKKFLYQIICNKKNEIDVDKWDYLARDSLQFNIKNSFDYKRIMVNCRVDLQESGDYEIVYRQKNEIDLKEMFRARYLNHYRGYKHPVCLIYEQMFLETLKLAVKENVLIPSKSNVPIKLTATNPEDFIQLTDHIFWDLYRNEKTSENIETILSRNHLDYNRNDLINQREFTLENFEEIKKNIIFYDK